MEGGRRKAEGEWDAVLSGSEVMVMSHASSLYVMVSLPVMQHLIMDLMLHISK